MARKRQHHLFRKDFLEDLQSALGFPLDLVCRSLYNQEEQAVQCIYLESMVDKSTIDNYILKSVTIDTFAEGEAPLSGGNVFLREFSFSDPYEELKEHAVQALLEGHCVLTDFVRERVCLINVTDPRQRTIDEPQSEPIIRGPHEGFTENITTNMGLVRKRIRNPSLRFERMSVGTQTGTTLLMVYMENLAPESLVREVRGRLQAIRTDSVLESAYVEEFIQDRVWSPFPTLTNTERPDVVAAQLLDGKVAVMVDGTPSVLLAPRHFSNFSVPLKIITNGRISPRLFAGFGCSLFLRPYSCLLCMSRRRRSIRN